MCAPESLAVEKLAPIVMLGIPYALMQGDYVRVDVVYERLPERGRFALDVFAAIIGMAAALLLIKYAIPYVEKSWVNGEGSPDPLCEDSGARNPDQKAHGQSAQV